MVAIKAANISVFVAEKYCLSLAISLMQAVVGQALLSLHQQTLLKKRKTLAILWCEQKYYAVVVMRILATFFLMVPHLQGFAIALIRLR